MSDHWKRPEGGPHQVAVRADLYQRRQQEVDQFFGRTLSKLDHNVVFERQSYVVFRFKEQRDAEEFARAFDGEPFDPRDLGSGKHWMRWYKGRAAKRRANRNPYDFTCED
jgi:hypothetical protein